MSNAQSADGQLRMESPLGPRMRIGGREVDYFCGTSYYCLHSHPDVIEAACVATRQFGMGPGTLAQMQVYNDLQDQLRTWFNAEHVVTLISGYSSPMALLQGLRDAFDIVFVDAATHYSARDALRTLVKPIHSFRHLDPGCLADALARNVAPEQRPVIVTDGVFPSSGALAPLHEYRRAMDRFEGALLVIDDSHGVGTLGPSGRGSLQHAGLESDGNFFAGTLSKAFGASGGIIPGSGELAEKIAANAMIMRGASPLTPGAAAAAAAAMHILQSNPEMKDNLARNVKQLRSGLRSLGFDVPETPVPIISVWGGPDLEHLRLKLDARDIIVRVVKPSGYSDAPDVPTMRLAVFSEHTPEQIDRLLSSIAELI
ncbi:aminotransferase class I/II-fold pyridoxal phosphate-dependent enzyme [Microvirga puerhi]|uniref:8-amino-7-oxononanoate synthase n=1 Tax=Microvirga puerhi TaxID=2876078 RepID=A0ABS7VTV1_9HYPH|nr:pyridoxal phosphate-dependent aminotransferase family protein [Microvirga puerhi]MBZ6079003.1 pyridoxal phosphate-dependent aminotransferase family protein [Microvirga puerhi]